MATPPELPPAPARPPLGTRFYIPLVLPLVGIVLTCCFANSSKIGGQVLAATGLVTFVCSIVLAVQLGQRLGKTDAGRVGMGVLMFLALQIFYAAAFFVGCAVTLTVS